MENSKQGWSLARKNVMKSGLDGGGGVKTMPTGGTVGPARLQILPDLKLFSQGHRWQSCAYLICPIITEEMDKGRLGLRLWEFLRRVTER